MNSLGLTGAVTAMANAICATALYKTEDLAGNSGVFSFAGGVRSQVGLVGDDDYIVPRADVVIRPYEARALAERINAFPTGSFCAFCP